LERRELLPFCLDLALSAILDVDAGFRQMEILNGLSGGSLIPPTIARSPVVTLDPNQMDQLFQRFEAAAAGRK
jgi:hypothetical protein